MADGIRGASFGSPSSLADDHHAGRAQDIRWRRIRLDCGDVELPIRAGKRAWWVDRVTGAIAPSSHRATLPNEASPPPAAARTSTTPKGQQTHPESPQSSGQGDLNQD
jgi:hypothetical protein